MAVQIAVRRDTYARWSEANPVLSAGEPAYDLTNATLRFGNGVDRFLDIDIYSASLSAEDAALVAQAVAVGTTSDEVIANQLGTTGSDSRTVLDAALDRIELVATPERFPGIDPSGATDSRAGLVAAFNAAPVGGKVIVPQGDYLVTGLLDFPVTRDISIDFSNSRLINDRITGQLARFWGAYETPVAVSAASIVTIPPSMWTELPSVGTSITTSTPQSWVIGDLVKVIADNPIPEGRVSHTEGIEARMGQTLKVHSVTGTTVILTGELREIANYTTNVRAAKLGSPQLTIRNAVITMTDSALANPGARSGLLIDYLAYPILENIRVERTSSSGIQVRSCYGYEFNNIVVGLARNDPANGAIGYGILDVSCEGGRINGLLAHKTRHAYTDDSSRIAVDRGPGEYGRTYGTRVVNSESIGSSTSSFDTHSYSQEVEFVNCTSRDSVTGFHLRGQYHHILNCRVINAQMAVDVSSESNQDETYGHNIDGLKADNISVVALNFSTHSGPTEPNFQLLDPRPSFVSNVTVTRSRGRLFKGNNNTVRYSNLRMVNNAPSTNAVVLVNTDFEGRGIDLDYTAVTLVSAAFFLHTDRVGRLWVDGLDIKWDAGTVDSLVSSTSTGRVCIRRATVSKPVTSVLQSTSVVSWHIPQSSVALDNGRISGHLNVGNAGVISADALRAPMADTDSAVVIIDATVTSALNLATLPNGKRFGQDLVIRNLAASSNNLTVRHGDPAYNTTLIGGTDKVLTPGMFITLRWLPDVYSWYQIL